MFLAKNPELLESFKRGERDAMESVYRHYVPGVSAFLRKGFTFRSGQGQFYFKGIQDPNELKPAVQEVFRRAFEDKARSSYNGVNSFTNWVLAIARNMVINKFRNREIAFSDYISASDSRSHLQVMDDEVRAEFTGLLYGQPSKSQDQLMEHTELEALMASFMTKLSQHDRQLMILRFAEGKSQEETASLLGSTRMKVRTSEGKLRVRLRAYLRNTGYIDHYLVQNASKRGTDRE